MIARRAQPPMGTQPMVPARAHEVQQDGAVHRVSRQRVAQFVADDEALLLVVHHIEQAGGDHDERLVHADRERVHGGGLEDEELRCLVGAQDLDAVPPQVVEVGELTFVDTDGRGEVHEAVLTFAQQTRQGPQDRVEAFQGAQCDERCPVCRVFPGPRADAGKLDSRAIRTCGHRPSLVDGSDQGSDRLVCPLPLRGD